MGRFTQHNIAVIQKAAKRPSTERMFDKEMGESLSAIADYVMEMMEEQIPLILATCMIVRVLAFMSMVCLLLFVTSVRPMLIVMVNGVIWS